MKPVLALALPLALALLAAPPATALDQPATATAAQRTEVRDAAALRRLQRNSGITLQWISFETPARGHVTVRERGGLYTISGSQAARTGQGLVTVQGHVVSIDRDRFTFQGRIAISDTPDPGRQCIRDGTYEFRVTQNRRYWRLQQMEECDGLTDYVDIYF